jgi:hypothetical protein
MIVKTTFIVTAKQLDPDFAKVLDEVIVKTGKKKPKRKR